jgi:hypothetical protein
LLKYNWIVQEKIHTPPTEEISAVRRGRGEKIVSDNSKCIRISEGGIGLTSYFLCGGGMDVFWNNPLSLKLHKNYKLNFLSFM